MRLLLAEDDQQLRDTVSRGLREHAFAVDAVADGDAALTHVAVNEYDAVILDIMLPKRDGLEVCQELRRRRISVPILLLTARDSVEDKITGLDAGADDYLTKPFAFGELLARIRALTRRREAVLPTMLVVADLELDTRRRSVRRAGRDIPLTAKEYAFIEHLARNAGRVVSRSELVAHVWDENHEPMGNVIDVYVSRLRRKIDAGELVPLLQIRRGVGIMLGNGPGAEHTGDAE
jgi:two-component system copper resistance phosphate regulon response regulator CusR